MVTKREYQVTSVQFREILKVCQGCHNLNHTAFYKFSASQKIFISITDPEFERNKFIRNFGNFYEITWLQRADDNVKTFANVNEIKIIRIMKNW
jgi:hypothetical protein